jgi:hypothetical protein
MQGNYEANGAVQIEGLKPLPYDVLTAALRDHLPVGRARRNSSTNFLDTIVRISDSWPYISSQSVCPIFKVLSFHIQTALASIFLKKRFLFSSLPREVKIRGSRNERMGESDVYNGDEHYHVQYYFFAVNFFARVVFIFSSEW